MSLGERLVSLIAAAVQMSAMRGQGGRGRRRQTGMPSAAGELSHSSYGKAISRHPPTAPR